MSLARATSRGGVRRLFVLIAAAGVWLASASPTRAQAAPSALDEFLRLTDGVLAIQVALGQSSAPDADMRLEAAARDFLARGAPPTDVAIMRSQLQVAADGFFLDLDRGIAGARDFPGPLPTEVSRALARTLLGTVRKKFGEAIARGEDPMPALAQAGKVLARVRGFTNLPRELDRFADAAERAERLSALLPPPPPAGSAPGGLGPMAQGPAGMAPPGGTVGPGGIAPPGGTPGPGGMAPPGGTAGPGGMAPPPPGGIPGPGGMAQGPAMGPTIPRATPGPVGGAPSGPGGMSPSPAAPPRGAPAPAPAPAVPVQESDPLLAVLGVGEMEAEARLEGFAFLDVTGRTWPPASDGEPDTEIELKISAPLFILDWIEVRSAPDPTVLIWSTKSGGDVQPLGVVHAGRLLNDDRGSVSGLEIEDFVVLRLYVQDDGFLESLEHPGTITITFRGGDIVTIPIEPLWSR